MAKSHLDGFNFPGSTMPLPSAFSLLAVPARLGVWTEKQLGELLNWRIGYEYLGWTTLASDHALERVSWALNRRPEIVRLGAQIKLWWPTSLHKLLRGEDPTRFDRLRFCRLCLLRGDHSPLFQLPWWSGCPVHDEPLYEACPRCHSPFPAGMPLKSPARWLVCSQCDYELSDKGLLAHLHAAPSRQHNETWWRVLAAYRRWLHSTQTVRWALPWDVQGKGSFEGIAQLAVAHLVASVPPPQELERHLPTPTLTYAISRAWSRSFIESPTTPSVQELGFASPEAMINAGRYYFGALPITDSCRRSLRVAERHLRRQLRIPLIGHGSPRAIPNAVLYEWRGKRTLAKLAFRLLTGLAITDRVDGVSYLDLRAVELLLEIPARMALNLLSPLTGVELREQHAWPREIATVLIEPKWMISSHRVTPKFRQDPMPRSAVGWLYERMIFETWHDLAIECFSRAKPGGIIAWTPGTMRGIEEMYQGFVYKPLIIDLDAESVIDQVAHPLLVHARANRQLPRGWATAILQVAGDGPETYVALFGRAEAQVFEPEHLPSFDAHWRWPDEMEQEGASSGSHTAS